MVGILRLNVRGTSVHDFNFSREYELIEPSSGEETDASQGVFGMKSGSTGGLPPKYQFYNVMWIHWEDGVAYRCAVGRVLREVWEEHATEWADVTLG